jgi:hypothetical protein
MTERIFAQSAGLILDIRLWSGSKHLKAEDFKGVELPPEELVSLGSKRIHNKEAFKPIQAVRTKAASLLESAGVSLYNGKLWIVPESRLKEIENGLAELAEEFNAEKSRFLEQFYSNQQQWLKKNKKWAAILEPYLESPESVEKKFVFTWRVFRMSSATSGDLAAEITTDMTSSIFNEICTLSAEAHETLKDRDRATPKNLNRLDRLARKLRGLSFIEPGLGIIEQELVGILDERDADGVMESASIYRLVRLLVQLKNADVLQDVLDAARNGESYRFVYADDDDGKPKTAEPVPSAPKKVANLPDAWF